MPQRVVLFHLRTMVFKGLGTGATTDFDGNFKIRTNRQADSVVASYVGYKSKTKSRCGYQWRDQFSTGRM